MTGILQFLSSERVFEGSPNARVPTMTLNTHLGVIFPFLLGYGCILLLKVFDVHFSDVKTLQSVIKTQLSRLFAIQLSSISIVTAGIKVATVKHGQKRNKIHATFKHIKLLSISTVSSFTFCLVILLHF